jgi:hypothetical protein
LQLYDAAESGDGATLTRLLAAGTNPNALVHIRQLVSGEERRVIVVMGGRVI